MSTNFGRLDSTILSTFGEDGRIWLANLPALIARTAEILSLKLQLPYPNLTYNYVAPGLDADGREVVLKLGVPNREFTSEVQALRLFAGVGCAEVFYSDAEAGIIVLERLVPGQPLTALANDQTDAEATSMACSVIRELHRPIAEDDCSLFQSTRELGNGFIRLRNEFEGEVGPFPQALIEEAEQLWSDLESTTVDRVLLHGDLHHDNIIAATRAPWLAIDPKGYVGDSAFETGAILRNLWEDRHTISNPAQTTQRRIDQFSEELGIERTRVRGWGLAQAVLSIWWSYEDNDPDWADGLEKAQIIAGIRH